MPGFFFVLIPLFLIGFGLLAYYSHLQAKQRREDLAQLADQLGWSFDPSRRYDWDSRYSQFGCFTRGHSRSAYNILQGMVEIEGRPYAGTMGDYTFKETSGSGKNRSTKTYHFSFVLIQLPFAGVPQLAVRQESFFDSITAFMGFDDIDFESEEFSRKFHVKSSDKRFAYDVIDPRMMEFMLDRKPPSFEIDRGILCCKSESSCWKPDEFADQLTWCQEFFARWPNHVVANLRSLAPR